MEDGAIWWRMPINAFCAEPDTPQVDLHDLVLWNSFSPYITVTVFSQLSAMRMRYRTRRGEQIEGAYL
jgi:hypothetical protein